MTGLILVGAAVALAFLAMTFRWSDFDNWPPEAGYLLIICYTAYCGLYFLHLYGGALGTVIGSVTVLCLRLIPDQTGGFKVVATFFFPLLSAILFVEGVSPSAFVIHGVGAGDLPKSAALLALPLFLVLIAARVMTRPRLQQPPRCEQIEQPSRREGIPTQYRGRLTSADEPKRLPPPRRDPDRW